MPSSEIERVTKLLKDDVSVDKIRKIREQLIKEKSTIEYQLNKQSKKRFQDAQSCLQIMTQSQKNMRLLKERLIKVDSLSKKNQTSISQYEIINEATRVHELLGNTLGIHSKILHYGEFMSQLRELLDIELSNDPLETGCPNLLKIHYMITKVRDFKDQMTVLALTSSIDVQTTTAKIFRDMDEYIKKFDKILSSITYDIIEGVRSQHISLLIRLFKVIHLEECEDIKIVATRNIIKAKELEKESNRIKKVPDVLSKFSQEHDSPVEYPTPLGLAIEINKGTIQSRTKERGYKSFFFNEIQQSIKEIFQEVRKEFQGDKKFEVLNNLDWVFNELIVVRDHIVPLAPDHWKLFEKYYEFYSEEIKKFILELIEAEPETIVILDILDFDKNFQKVLNSEFGLSKEKIKSVIGDKEKDNLLSDYLNLILKKMKEWIGNLEQTELRVFKERSTPPHTDSDNWLFLDGTKTCFQMFNQQVEVAAGSGQAKILLGVVERFCSLLVSRQDTWVRNIHEEVTRCIEYNHIFEDNPESITKENQFPAGLLEYLVAVANDQMKAADYAIAISQKYGSYVSKVHERNITAQIEKTLDGFAYVAKCATGGITQLIFDDLRKPYAEIFGKNWNGGNQAIQISSTIQEYLNDVREQMNPFVFYSLVETVAEETLLLYVTCLKRGNSIKNKDSKFLDCVRTDFETFYKVLVSYLPVEEKYMVDDKFKFAEYFIDFTCDSPESIIESWKQCLGTFWDCPISVLEHILSNRRDVDKSQAKKLLAEAESVKNNPVRINHLNSLELQSTFISRFDL